MIEPIFLFSLPRAGSTLAQRILGSSKNIATVPEPWLLLPYLYTLREKGCYAEYDHENVVSGINNFIKALPNNKADYIAEMREFVLRLYAKASGEGARYFLDKTPRYHLVADDVVGMFPDAKFICLWRNPLAIIASIIETWGGGKWNVYRFKVDVFDGLANLVSACQKHKDIIYSVRYEDLIANPTDEWRKVFNYLDIPFDDNVLTNFKDVILEGKLGDPTGKVNYQAISSEPLEKWKSTLSSPARKAWCRNYLKWIGEERLSVMGYELKQLLEELDAIPTNLGTLASDITRFGFGVAHCAIELRIVKRKLKILPAWHRVHAHT